MLSNVFLWRSGNYFWLAESITPLLHIWSLSVEEQLYLLFPVMLVVAERLRVTRVLVSVLLFASFLLCLFATLSSPAARLRTH